MSLHSAPSAPGASLDLLDQTFQADPYPTYAEALRQVGDLYNRTRLTPRTKALLRAVIALRR